MYIYTYRTRVLVSRAKKGLSFTPLCINTCDAFVCAYLERRFYAIQMYVCACAQYAYTPIEYDILLYVLWYIVQTELAHEVERPNLTLLCV